MLEIFAISSTQKLAATILLAILGLGFLGCVVMLLVSIRHQRSYDKDSLPMLGELMEEVPEDAEEEEDDAPSVFQLDDDEEDALPDLGLEGDRDAEELLRAARQAQQGGGATKLSPWSKFSSRMEKKSSK